MGMLQLPDVGTPMEEVKKSLELVTQMRELMQSRGKSAREELEITDKVLGSLAAALEVLQAHEAAEMGGGGEDSACMVGSPCSETGGGYFGRRKGGGLAKKRGAGRSRSHPFSCHQITSSTLKDGSPWRKYGQKEIQSSKYPRSYYRCTYKYTKGCSAIRQVQPMEDDPSTYIITYIGHHTCNEPQTSATSNDHSSPIEEKLTPEQVAPDLPPSPRSAATDLAVPKREADGVKEDDLCWKELGPLPDSERSPDVSSSSMYGDVEMFEGFDISKYFCLEPSEVLLCGV